MNILITGARSNIGYNLAKHLSLRGHIVYAGCKTLKEKVALEEKISQEKIIMLLHASISNGGSILEISNDRFNEVIDVNIKGNFRLLQRYLRYCYYHRKKGKVFITSSIAAFYPLPYLSTYTSGKLYLYHLASTLRLELPIIQVLMT